MLSKKLFFIVALLSLVVFVDQIHADEKYRIAVMKDDFANADFSVIEDLSSILKSEAYELTILDADSLTDSTQWTTERFDLLILPASDRLPISGIQSIQKFIAGGGDILALQAPAFVDPVWKVGDRWISTTEWRKEIQELKTDHVLFDFEQEDLNRWQRHSSSPQSPFVRELASGFEGKALHIDIPNMTGWDGLASPILKQPFAAEETLTCFYAKGVGKTQSLSLEWDEKDGSRWIAVFPVTENWQRIVLTPSDFKFWQSVPNRGRAGDRFNPQNAVQLIIGVAQSHTGLRTGEYEFFIDQIGTAINPLSDVPTGVQNPPPIENLCPFYKFYPIRDCAQLTAKTGQGIVSLPLPQNLAAHHPRPTGKGFNKQRTWRWLPIADAYGSKGEWRGAPVSLWIDFTTSSLRAAFSITDSRWYNHTDVHTLLSQTVQRLAEGIFFQEAGTEFFTVSPGQSLIVGARTANLSRRESGELTVRYRITPKGESQQLYEKSDIVSIPAGQIHTASYIVNLPRDRKEYQITVSLLRGERVLDEIAQEIGVYQPKPESQRAFVQYRKGDFYVEDEKWYVHGVNYMPSTGIATETGEYFERWLGSRSYDPEFIQRDLERCRDLGFNSISIFLYYQNLKENNLLDILRRCDNLGLKVNLSLRPGTPMNYDRQQWEAIIRQDQLWENDVIYAYDIAWEPFFGTETERRNYDPEWRKWIVKKYGSVKDAEKSWSFPAPRFAGLVTNPTADYLGKDGAHRKMVADYRAFVDELIHAKYQEAADFIRVLDPHHLISFRMTVTGDPTFDGSNNMPYDFKGVARCMDFLAPEGYGRIGDWERVKPGIFTVAYARYCAPDKPVIWAEAGVSAWNSQSMQTDPMMLETQGQFFSDFYQMVLKSNSNGIVWWWYPGGFRWNENSDFGIINPDGTDRPATRVIREMAAKVLSPRRIPQPDVWLNINRDSDARGLVGIYQRVKNSFWQVIDAGKTPGLRDQSSTGVFEIRD